MQEIRLDFLANFPLNNQANAIFNTHTYSNLNTLDSAVLEKLKKDSKKLAALFGKEYAQSFNYSCGDFMALFTLLSKHYNVFLAAGLHQQSFYAAQIIHALNITIFATAQDLLQLLESKNIRSLQKPPIFFIPIINQDILTQNPINTIIDSIFSIHKNALIFLDISLFMSIARTKDLQSLRSILTHPQVIALCNIENIGLMRSGGFLLYDKQNLEEKDPQICPLLNEYMNITLTRPSLFEAAHFAIEQILQKQEISHVKTLFFEALQERLGENVGLFAPLEQSAINALPLRFKGIKARMLIQSLNVHRIYAINGQDCLFGNAKPSFVLQCMGYDELTCRELLSVSFESLNDIHKCAQIIAQSYNSLRMLGV